MIDDDVALTDSLRRLLAMDGLRLDAVHRAEEGLTRALEGRHAIVILDIMLPDGDGRQILRRIRQASEVPVIMLTARGDDKDRIQGLEAGADDYLPKPFNPRELVARIRAVLKRGRPPAMPAAALTIDGLTLRTHTRKVTLNNETIDVTGAEFDILLLLVQSAGQIITREKLAQFALGRDLGAFDRSIDNHVSNLRKKLGPLPDDGERIRSVRGSGYLYAGELIVESA
ncbi:two component transcriptional regulator, winged helix family (plasmid) [Granulicella tundricola MP5ACTX9]|uniref:Two component transcriptional regulator, winged helix family n=2 Tax=Granulicella TaxID=940557 RepID=E8X6I3_GRATM|nr:two component transcriptional regulator, winged helix family [Granulicella tundricola MP5ACTX9]